MSLLRPPSAFLPRRESVDPHGAFSSNAAPVGIFIGADVDDATAPPTYERNRFVADLVLHYACAPFITGGSRGFDIWSRRAPASSVFVWFNDRLPPVGVGEMTSFHDAEYVRYLSVRETLSDIDESASAESQLRSVKIQPSVTRRSSLSTRTERPLRSPPDLQPIPSDSDYGLREAVPFVGLWRTIQATTSGTLTAVRWLMGTNLAETPSPVPQPRPRRMAAVHWFGGRHHAKRDSASGFCFINDVVLGAIAMKQGLPPGKSKILIVDVDAHHGDGTFEAFQFDPDVFTLSVHGYGTGFFPNTGGVEETGMGRGRGSNVNVPLPEGSTDRILVPLARHAIRAAAHKLGDELGGIVLVCGADGLQGDVLGHLNYSIAGVQCVVRLVLEMAAAYDAKLLVLGGGGYVDTSTARLSAVVTRDVLSWATARMESRLDFFSHSPNLLTELGIPVPENSDYFTRYGPSFLMHGLPPPVTELVKDLPTTHPFYKLLATLNARAPDSRAPSAGFRRM